MAVQRLNGELPEPIYYEHVERCHQAYFIYSGATS